jgi:hypothetical protein
MTWDDLPVQAKFDVVNDVPEMFRRHVEQCICRNAWPKSPAMSDGKIGAHHRARKAILYVRQSSLQQTAGASAVRASTERTARSRRLSESLPETAQKLCDEAIGKPETIVAKLCHYCRSVLEDSQPSCTGYNAQSTDDCEASAGCDGAPAAFVDEQSIGMKLLG